MRIRSITDSLHLSGQIEILLDGTLSDKDARVMYIIFPPFHLNFKHHRIYSSANKLVKGWCYQTISHQVSIVRCNRCGCWHWGNKTTFILRMEQILFIDLELISTTTILKMESIPVRINQGRADATKLSHIRFLL